MENGLPRPRRRLSYQQQQLQEQKSSFQHLPPRSPSASSSFQPPPDPTDAWNTASRLSRSRKVVRQQPSNYSFSGENFPSGRDTMRIDMRRDMDGFVVGDDVVIINGKVGGGSGKKLDSAGVGNWIDKYQHSDHHADRLVRTIVQYEKTTGQRFPDAKLIPVDYANHRAKNLVSDLPDVVYVQTPSIVDRPVIIETQSLPPRRPSVDRGPLGLSHLQSQPGSCVYYRRPSISRSYLSPAPDHTTSNGHSLPNTSLDPYRRRASISVTPYRGTSLLSPTTQRGSPRPSLGLPPLPTHVDSFSPVTGSYRRASYSGVSPSMTRSYLTPATPTSSYSRHTTPDRGLDVPVRRPSISVSGPRLGSRPPSRSGSVDRSISPSPANSYMYQNQPSAPISDARKKIRQVLYKVSGDEDYLP